MQRDGTGNCSDANFASKVVSTLSQIANTNCAEKYYGMPAELMVAPVRELQPAGGVAARGVATADSGRARCICRYLKAPATTPLHTLHA